MRFVALLAVVAMALAGCGGGASTSSSGIADTGDEPQLHLQNLTFVAEAREVTETFSGTFPLTDGSLLGPAGGIVNDPQRRHDLQSLLGQGHNFVVVEEVAGGNDFLVQLAFDDAGAIWSDVSPDEQHAEAVVVGPARLELVVTFTGTALNDLPGHADGADYEVIVTVAQDPQRIPSGMAIEVELPSVGSHVVFSALDGWVPDVLVFDPKDSFVARLAQDESIRFELDATMNAGAYVFLPLGHGQFYRLAAATTEDREPSARILGQDGMAHAPEEIEPGAAHLVEWTEVVRTPAANLRLCADATWGSGAAPRAEILDPEGNVMAGGEIAGAQSTGYNVCVAPEGPREELLPGTYTFRYADDGSAGVRVSGMVRAYQR